MVPFFVVALTTLVAGDSINISEICIHNKAGFAVKIYIASDKGGEPVQTPDQYTAGYTRCVNGFNLDPMIADGDHVHCVTKAVAGKTQACSGDWLEHVYQSDSARRAMYECTGATLTYTCKLKYYQDLVPQCTANELGIFATNLGTGKYEADMKSCGLKCLGISGCVANCMSDKEGFSKVCASCMGDLQACTVYSCPVCSVNAGEKCVACTVKNCVNMFASCTGLNQATANQVAALSAVYNVTTIV